MPFPNTLKRSATGTLRGWHHYDAAAPHEVAKRERGLPGMGMGAAQAFSPLTGPGVAFLSTSYAQSLSVRDNVKGRRLIESPWYKRGWGDRFRLTSDQNTKIRFDNDQGGYRIASSVDGSATGEGGDIIIIDDPISANNALSPTIPHGRERLVRQHHDHAPERPENGRIHHRHAAPA
jgi:hypothetical protein